MYIKYRIYYYICWFKITLGFSIQKKTCLFFVLFFPALKSIPYSKSIIFFILVLATFNFVSVL